VNKKPDSPLGGLKQIVDLTDGLLEKQLELKQQNRLLADALVGAVNLIRMKQGEDPEEFKQVARWCLGRPPQSEQAEGWSKWVQEQVGDLREEMLRKGELQCSKKPDNS